MSDIVYRLRTYVACDGGDLADVAEAADEIERLRDQLHLADAVRAAQVEGLTQGAAGWRERATRLEAEVAGLREASKSALLVLCALRDATDWHPNMVKDIDFAIDAARKGTT